MSEDLKLETDALRSAADEHRGTAERVAGYEGTMHARVGGLRVGSGSIGGVIARGAERIATTVIEDLPKAVSKALHAMADDHDGIARTIDTAEHDLTAKAGKQTDDVLARNATGDLERAAADRAATAKPEVQLSRGAVPKIDELMPNTIYRDGATTFETDAQGRVVRMTAPDLKIAKGARHYTQTEIGHLGGSDYQGGHLQGSRFDGFPGAPNVLPMLRKLNLSEYKSLENQWAKAVAAGHRIDVSVQATYADGSKVPSAFRILTTTDGKTGPPVRFQNR